MRVKAFIQKENADCSINDEIALLLMNSVIDNQMNQSSCIYE